MDRPYKKGWSKERVHDYLLEKRGSQFDPQLVDTILLYWDYFPFEGDGEHSA
jgi:HD-GYP domain-containing protein (c-di-GMP phosphodiesterase class II)